MERAEKGARAACVAYRGGGLCTVSCHLAPHDQRTKSATSLTRLMQTHCAGDSVGNCPTVSTASVGPLGLGITNWLQSERLYLLSHSSSLLSHTHRGGKKKKKKERKKGGGGV